MIDILIVGIGGIGGFFGGLLAKRFEESPQIKIHFLARGTNLDAIKRDGIRIQDGELTFTTRPASASETINHLKKVHYIILCTKSYDLENTVKMLSPCVDETTVFLPLLNGVDSKYHIQKIFPFNLVAEGCANIITRLTAPGQIACFSTFKTITFGLQDEQDARLDYLHTLFSKAGISALLTSNIWNAVWLKFIFISAAATATSYVNKSFGEIINNLEYRKIYTSLLSEICQLAELKNIKLPKDIQQKSIDILRDAPPTNTTSMHSDFISNKGNTEVESLTGYVVREAEGYQLEVPTYKAIYTFLSNPTMLIHYHGINQSTQ